MRRYTGKRRSWLSPTGAATLLAIWGAALIAVLESLI